MKQIIAIILACGALISRAQIKFDRQVRLPAKGDEIIFDHALPQIITCERTFYHMMVYVQDLNHNTCDTIKAESPGVIGKKEMPLDLKIFAPDSFFLLTNERLLKIWHKGNSLRVVQSEPLPQRTYNTLLMRGDELFLVSMFTPDAKRFPKINIRNHSADKHYKHFASCDPHAIYSSSYNLVTMNANGIFCIIKDNVNPSLTFLDADFNEIRTIDALPAPNPPVLIDKACEFDRKYNAHGTQAVFDSMKHYLNVLGTIEKIFFIGPDKLLVIGMQSDGKELEPLMRVLIFDEKWNITGVQPLKPFAPQEERKEAFASGRITLNAYGKKVKERNGVLIFRSKYIDHARLVHLSDYYNAYNAATKKDAYYLFKPE